MDRAVYDAMAADEDRHWWFIGRRRVLDAVIRRHALPPAPARILEAGCGSGGNLAMLSAFGALEAFELDDQARAVAAARGIGEVSAAQLPDLYGIEDSRYHLIGLFDVLEHLPEDVAALIALGRKLAPGGKLVISVPALPWLWSAHDVSHHHQRRYTRGSLKAAAEAAGLKVHHIGGFQTLLFPLAMVQRLILRITGFGKGASGMPSPPINAMLARIFAAERHLVGRVPMPFGLSYWAVLSRGEDAT
ncbi:MAG: class I SAM-dependent methyltransferase [Pseudomonadota bacterium]